MTKRFGVTLIFASLACLAGCGNKQNSVEINHRMGERVAVGPLTYTVIESSWKSQLGEGFHIRVPQRRFLLVSISVTNGGGRQVSVPLLSLVDSKGGTFQELSDGESVDQWFGLLRNVDPAQTDEGRLLFDVPLGSYRLRLSNGSEAEAEKYAYVDIPLGMDTDPNVEAPLPNAAGASR